MEKISIRNAEPGDIEKIMHIEHESFQEHIRESRDVFLDRISAFREGFLVMEICEDICGYISSEIWDYAENITATSFTLNHRISETHTTTGSELYISSIGILEKYRGKGYGNLLFTELSCRMIEKYVISSMILLVSASWDAARKIYEKNGFEEMCRIPGFFDKVNEGIVMRKHL
ncbi:MAG: N-acetyltransferase [Methanolobus sp.]|uniref:GNAT family N-acetyltransferase n=1 Tax=Methanolobus sp. TaxID=1874737 RepID=UPI00272FDD3E|nr:N-acetyltransferase [Methanolobus sp.]MDP2215792.1 N-acetyltransferase [Methanolobus sp.]